MQSPLQKQLATIAPNIAIETIWERDEYMEWDVEDDSLDPNDFEAWSAEVRASAIINGKIVIGYSLLGGIWQDRYKKTTVFDPEIDGYERQMTMEALEELLGKIIGARDIEYPIGDALEFLHKN